MKIEKEVLKGEVKDLIISVLVIALIFSYAVNNRNIQATLNQLPFFLVVVVVAFLFHELAHRFVARKFGCVAIYKIWTEGLLFSLLFSLVTGAIILAPGAVVIYPYTFGRFGYRRVHLTHSESGLISIAGPATNLFFAALFRLFTGNIFEFLSFVNAWLALFNLLPVPPLDGSKVMGWKPWIWLVSFILAGLLVFL